MSLDYKNISGNLFGVNGSIGVNGHLDALIGLANAIATPLGRKEAWIPYIGGGIGFAHADSKISSIGNTSLSGGSDNETDLALDGLVGVDFPIADGFSVGGRYQYLWVNSSSSSSRSGFNLNEGNFGASILTAQATYRF